MNKLLFACLAVALVSALHVSRAMAHSDKVEVCHIIAANDVIPFLGGVDLLFGKVITVSPKAVAAHEGHGDSTCFFPPEDAAGPINLFREAGAQLPAANCFFSIDPGTGEQRAPAECLED